MLLFKRSGVVAWTAAFWMLVPAAIGFGQAGKEIEQSVASSPESEDKWEAVKTELAERVARDQKARMAMIACAKEGESGKARLIELQASVRKIDTENKTWLSQQIKANGWPGKSRVGDAGAHNAWLLVQHADQDLLFQKRCLDLMTQMPAGEVAPVDIAYLTDRVLSAEGKPQRYGTQCSLENGKAVVKSVEDPENLNKRRAKLGLEPIEKYLAFVESVYSKPKPTEKPDPKAASPKKSDGQKNDNK